MYFLIPVIEKIFQFLFYNPRCRLDYTLPIDDFFRCRCCHVLFDDNQHEPKLLPCLDTVCLACLSMNLDDNVVQCPCCNGKMKVAHDVTSSETAYFRQDSTLMRLFHSWPKYIRQKLRCDRCNKLAKLLCSNCNESLCSKCGEFHRSLKVSSNHVLLDFHDVYFSLIKTIKSPNLKFCAVPTHENNHVDKYCTSKQCKKAICPRCAETEHSNTEMHHVLDLLDVFTKSKYDIIRLSTDLEEILLKVEVKLYMFIKILRTNIKKAKKRNEMKLLEELELTVIDGLASYLVRIHVIRRAAKDLMMHTSMEEFLEELDKVKCPLEDLKKDALYNFSLEEPCNSDLNKRIPITISCTKAYIQTNSFLHGKNSLLTTHSPLFAEDSGTGRNSFSTQEDETQPPLSGYNIMNNSN